MTSRASASAARPLGSGPPARTAASIPLDRGRLGLGHELVDRQVASGRLADEQRPGHVAPIAVDLRPEVEQEDLAGHGPADRPASRGASAASGPARQATSKASPSAPPVRISHSSRSASSRSVAPTRISGRSVARARSATAQAAAIRSISAGSLIARSASSQPSTGTSSTSGRPQRRASIHVAWLTSSASTATRRAPTDADQLRPARLEVAVDRLDPGVGRLALGLDPVAAVGEQDDLVGGDQEPARRSGDPVLAVAEDEAGEIARVLGPDAEVGVEAGLASRARRRSSRCGPGRSVGGRPAGAIGRARAGRRSRPGDGCRGRPASAVTGSRTSSGWPGAPCRSWRRRACRRRPGSATK